MSHAMLSVDTIIKAAGVAMNVELDPQDLEGLSAITRMNLLAALAHAAQEETPPVSTMAITADDFALLSTFWRAARDGEDEREKPALGKPTLVKG